MSNNFQSLQFHKVDMERKKKKKNILKNFSFNDYILARKNKKYINIQLTTRILSNRLIIPVFATEGS